MLGKMLLEFQLWWYRNHSIYVTLDEEKNSFFLELTKGELLGFELDNESTDTLFIAISAAPGRFIEFELSGVQIRIPAWAVKRMLGQFAEAMRQRRGVVSVDDHNPDEKNIE